MTTADRPLLLVSNDDGVLARGLRALADAAAKFADVWVVAPEIERSAASHAITLHRPLRLREIGERTFALDGTPVDCIYIALHGLLPRRPDAVLVGVNPGPNLGTDVFYSGTVGAAREGALRGIPSVAVSLAEEGDLDAAASLGARLAERLVERLNGVDPRLYNVNVPAGQWRGVRATRLGARTYHDSVQQRVDPRGRKYYWIGGPGVSSANTEGTDGGAIESGYVSVTPLGLDLTVASALGSCQSICQDLE